MRQRGIREPWTADESPESAPTDNLSGRAFSPLSAAPDCANSSRFHSAPVGRDSRRAVDEPLHRPALPCFPRRSPAKAGPLRSTVSNRRRQAARRRERVSFRQLPSAGRQRIRALPKLPPSQHPKISLTTAVRAGRWPYAWPICGFQTLRSCEICGTCQRRKKMRRRWH